VKQVTDIVMEIVNGLLVLFIGGKKELKTIRRGDERWKL